MFKLGGAKNRMKNAALIVIVLVVLVIGSNRPGGSWVYSLALLVSTAFFGLVLFTIQDWFRRRGMASRGVRAGTYPVVVSVRFRVRLAMEDAIAVCTDALLSIPTSKRESLSSELPMMISIKTRTTLASWGERVSATISKCSDYVEVTLVSKPLLGTVAADWGANIHNVLTVLRAIMRVAPLEIIESNAKSAIVEALQ